MNKLKRILIEQLRQGVSVHDLSKTIAVAVAAALFPLIGFTTLLCAALGSLMRLNHPTMQIINYAMTPVHLLMIPIFLRIGEFVWGAEPTPVMPQQMVAEFGRSPIHFLQLYGKAGALAVFTWSIVAPLAGLALFFILRPVLRMFARRHVRS